MTTGSTEVFGCDGGRRRRVLRKLKPVVWVGCWLVIVAVWKSHEARACTRAAAADSEPPSIVLISVDTLRADRLGCYGSRHTPTPHIDAIAQGGTRFTAIDSQVPLTFPSHVSLFTSTYPFFNGIEDNGEVLRPDAVTLATVLKLHGYRTGAFIGGFTLDRRFGLNQGFDDYDSTFDLHRQGDSDPGDVKRRGSEVVAAAIRWLPSNDLRPFFLFLHLYDLHTPYNLPASYRARYGTGYDAELRYVDDQIGVFWDALRQRHLLGKTLVVFVSDHGESLGEHGEQTHGYFIYQSTIWVPLIIHWPDGREKATPRVDTPASLMDVAPTVVQIAGIPPPREFQGRSLLELLHPGASDAARAVYSESLYAHEHFECAPLRSVRLGRYQYIQAPKPELYDLAADPGETRNLYRQNRSLALASEEKLNSLRARFGSDHPLGGKVLDPEAVARLSSLGYVAVSSPQAAAGETGADPKDRIAAFEEYGRAIILASTGHVDEANAILEKLLAGNPDLADVRMSLGLNDQRRRRPQEAAREFVQVLKANPYNVQAHFDLGLSFYQLREMDEAAKECNAALAIAPYYTRAEELLGSIDLEKGDYGGGREHFEHILTIDPSDYSAHYNLGALDTLQGQWVEGEQQLQSALKVDPEAADAHNVLGSLYFRESDLPRAEREFQQAIRLRPGFASAHYNLGLAFREQDRQNDAINEFRQALAADPQFRPAREALGLPDPPPK